ncbi:MAG: hypothetical protein CL679_09605 [Bermanella sp.]|nr:hypothetical protein [Bermanella sp.]|tara:strand:- start:5295 stop:5483 length:189 start_codon:yes stop_codon:yes gene_type:complete
MLKALILLFLLFSIGALFYGFFHLMTAPKSSEKTFKSLKYRVIFAAFTIILIGLFFFMEHYS